MKIRVADYIANFLYEHNIDCIFMMSGGGSIYLDDGVACHPYLKYVGVKNEATAPMMAEAYARLKGGVGAVYVTTGPGGANAVTGVAEAWVDSAPIIVISGQVPKKHTTHYSNIKGIRTLGCQELDIIEIVKPITKYATMVKDPTSIKWNLEKALHMATTGRPGPVWLDIPLDIQSSVIEEENLDSFTAKYDQFLIDDETITEALNLISSSLYPLIIVGQGVRQANAIEEIKSFIEVTRFPVVSSRLGQDIFSFDFPYYFGHGGSKGSPAVFSISKKADLIISLGSRLSIPFIGQNMEMFNKDIKIIAIDIEKAELIKLGGKISLPICGDVKDFLIKINQKIKEVHQHFGYELWLKECVEHKKNSSLTFSFKEEDPIDLYHFVSRIDQLSSDDHVFVSDAGSSYYVCGQSLSFNNAKREITSGAFASMGLAIPLAIGCCAADNKKQVLAITGDGSIESNIQELKTLSDYKMNAKIFIINNGGYASIREVQDTLFDGRRINSNQKEENTLLDFCKVSDTFNIPYFLISNCEQIEPVFKKVINFNGPAIIEVLCDSGQHIISCY